MSNEIKFSIDRILDEVKEQPIADQIRELRRYKAEFLRLPPLSQLSYFETPFPRQVDIEIQRLEHEVSNTPNVFKVSSKNGAKSELLQVFYALHKLNLIEKKDGGFPTQHEFLTELGKFLGEDWIKSSVLLSQRRTDTTVEKQNAVFEGLQAKWHNKKTT